MIPRKITLKDYKFQNEYYVSGHYDFIIDVEYEGDNKKQIERRYSEIRALYKTLIINCPGCLIPNIPSKSIWLKINVGNKDQMEERKEGIREFLSHLATHKVLRKNKFVIDFFSSDYKRIVNDKKSTKKGNNSENNDSDDEFNPPPFDFDKNDNKDKEKNKSDDILDDDDIMPLNEFIEEYNNKKKGIVSKGKEIFGNMYSYLKSFTTSNNNNEEEKENNNTNNFDKELTKEDHEFISKKSKELGEDFEIKEYEEKISRLNEGLKSIIDNFEKLIVINDKKYANLDNIIKNDNILKNLSKGNFINEDEFGEEDNDKEISINNSHKSNIMKLRLYNANQKDFWKKNVENLKKIKKYQILLQGLLDIYIRKKEHINFLGRLHSKKEEMEKENENKNEYMMKTKIEDLEKKLKHEIKFINKINKDLKYELDKYKENQEDIYIYINSFYKEKSNIIKNSIENLNKEYLEEPKEDQTENSNIIDKNKDKENKVKEYIDENKYDDF